MRHVLLVSEWYDRQMRITQWLVSLFTANYARISVWKLHVCPMYVLVTTTPLCYCIGTHIHCIITESLKISDCVKLVVVSMYKFGLLVGYCNNIDLFGLPLCLWYTGT